MDLKKLDPNDIEIELAAQRVLLGWKAAGQPLNTEPQDQEASNDSVERIEAMLPSSKSEKRFNLPKVSYKKRKQIPRYKARNLLTAYFH